MRKVVHPDYPEYLIREDGLVERAVDSQRGPKAGDVLHGRVLKSGYRQFKLFHRDGAQRLVRANRLVCEAFHGKPPTAKHHSAHENGERLDNSPGNLYWATPRQNKRDSIRHGTAVYGSTVVNQHGPAKITAAAVSVIRSEYTGAYGELVRFARRYGVRPACIHKIIAGQTWKHVQRGRRCTAST